MERLGNPGRKDRLACDCAGEVDRRVGEIIKQHQRRPGELIPLLKHIQQEFGYLPERAMGLVGGFLRIPESTVFATATFFSHFKLVPTGRNIIRVCRGNACQVRGGKKILRVLEKHLGIKPGESTPDLKYALETVSCLSACAMAPAVVIDGDTYGYMTTERITEIISLKDALEEGEK